MQYIIWNRFFAISITEKQVIAVFSIQGVTPQCGDHISTSGYGIAYDVLHWSNYGLNH